MTENTTLTARERLRIHLSEARRTTDSPIVEAQLDAALDACNDLPPTPLQECTVCGKVGLPERIRNHYSIEQCIELILSDMERIEVDFAINALEEYYSSKFSSGSNLDSDTIKEAIQGI